MGNLKLGRGGSHLKHQQLNGFWQNKELTKLGSIVMNKDDASDRTPTFLFLAVRLLRLILSLVLKLPFHPRPPRNNAAGYYLGSIKTHLQVLQNVVYGIQH